MSRIYHTTRWRLTRRRILERDNHRCYWCGNHSATQVDHLKALSMGGAAYDPANLVASCQPCNAKRGRALQTGSTLQLALEPQITRNGAIRI